MKLCKDCKNVVGSIVCRAPENGVSVIDGQSEPVLCIFARSQSIGALCGPEAKLFVQKVEEKSWFKRLF
jgi:hypothetical protein